MAISEQRLSTTVVAGSWLPPDDRNRALDEDWETGPVALLDTSEGIKYQDWYLTHELNGDFVVTPQTTGSPQVIINVPGVVTQCSLCFDQNAHVNIAYTLAGGQAYLYWYDTNAADWTTTTLSSATFCPTLTLDDKRPLQSGANDILLWWTEEQPDATHKLFHAMQRDRFEPIVPYEMASNVYPYIYKLGMNNVLRVQIGLSDRIL